MNITREQLQDAIEAGLAASPKLTDAECQALAKVGQTTNAVMAQDYFDQCGCPATQAGLTDLDCGIPDAIIDFANAFDDYVSENITHVCHPTLLEVTNA